MTKKQTSEKVLLISWGVLTVATVGLGKRFYGHYWQYAIPVLVILGTLFFQEIYCFKELSRAKFCRVET